MPTPSASSEEASEAQLQADGWKSNIWLLEHSLLWLISGACARGQGMFLRLRSFYPGGRAEFRLASQDLPSQRRGSPGHHSVGKAPCVFIRHIDRAPTTFRRSSHSHDTQELEKHSLPLPGWGLFSLLLRWTSKQTKPRR